MADTKTYIYSVDVQCSIGGTKVDVSSLSINLAANAFPSITMTIGGLAGKGGTSVSNVSVDQVVKLVDTLSSSVYKPVGNVAVKIKGIAGGAQSDSITLKNWYVAGVGLSDLSGSAQFSAQVT